MRKHGWQPPYHPLQVVAIAVFMALGFAFYVFFVPFVGEKILQYIVAGTYSLLIQVALVFGLYIWCAAADPADPGVLKSGKYLTPLKNQKRIRPKNSRLGGELTSSIQNSNSLIPDWNIMDKSIRDTNVVQNNCHTDIEKKNNASSGCFMGLLSRFLCAFVGYSCSPSNRSSGQRISEDGLFYCRLCEVEVFEYSKHCKACDKCVDGFDHHCRWLNNCVGKKNYRKFLTLTVSSLLLLIIQWSTGSLVLMCCFLERKRFSVDVVSKLGSSFTLLPYVTVVAMSIMLAIVVTILLAQLFIFHVLLIKKGISTYDYLMAMKGIEQEPQGVGDQQSSQMFPGSSHTRLSSTSSFTSFPHGVQCTTPPHQFIEDQFDVVPPETGCISSIRKKTAIDESMKKKKIEAVKINPWALAQLNADKVSRAAADGRKKSISMQPMVKRDAPLVLEADSNVGSSSQAMLTRLDSNRRRANKRVRLPDGIRMDPLTMPTSLAPLQLEARSAFKSSRALSSSAGIVTSSSPGSSLDSPSVIHPFRVYSSGAEDHSDQSGTASLHKGIPTPRSTSDGYEASGGEDSDLVLSY